VSAYELLFGRQEEAQSLVETLNTPGQHVLLFGDRGVGKSSLANVVAEVLSMSAGLRVYRKRCDSQDTFETILRGPLAAVGVDLHLSEVMATDERATSAGLNQGPVNIDRSWNASIAATYRAHGNLSPSVASEALKDLEGLFLIDEADAIAKSEDRRRWAELIKHLSDDKSRFKIMVVGIAATAADLKAGHESVGRCLREVELPRMQDDELREIVTSGAKSLNMVFQPGVVETIVDLSAGYPHFTHLLALKCAEDAVSENRRTVDREHLEVAMKRAVKDAEGTLRQAYNDSVRSATTDMYRVVIMASASLGTKEFSSSDLRSKVKVMNGTDVSQQSLNNYFQRLVSNDGSTILRRTAQGHYRFEDPRMVSFVRMANEMF